MIVRHGMKPMFLRFLCNLCMVDNKAMGAMQDRVCGLLQQHEGDLFVKCSISNAEDEPITLNHGKSFANEIQIFKQGSVKKIPGEHLLRQKVKPLRLSWNPRWPKGGVHTMLLNDLVLMSGAKRRTNTSEYAELYHYFIEQLRLFNALCLGRNYLGILYVEEQMRFSYEVLLQGIMDNSLPWGMRDRFCRLMTSLHIDREPYVMVTFPNLTRLADEETVADTDDQSGSNQFTLLQCLVLQHLRDFQLSKAMHQDQIGFMRFLAALVDALLTLVQLDFFPRQNMLLEFVEPLLECLDGTGDVLNGGSGRRATLTRAPTLRPMTTAKNKHGAKVFPERATNVQKQSVRQIASEEEGDDVDDEGKGCCEKLKQKKLTFFQRVDIFINSTPYMIVMTAFVFVATIIGFVSLTL